ncbi:hypothetical protein D5086_022642 [Populus alba]|uniref:Uncharacterized protein n=1 Tax=Populus alba TaxID=43335 RepID=A0ACC4BH17_POPAL
MDPRPGLKHVQPITMRPKTRPNLKPGGASIPSGLLIHLMVVAKSKGGSSTAAIVLFEVKKGVPFRLPENLIHHSRL